MSLVPLPENDSHRGTTLLSLLHHAATFQSDHGLIFRELDHKTEFSELKYSQLWNLAVSNASILLDNRVVTPRQPILLYFKHYRESIVWYWSVVAAGGIPALLPPPKGDDEAYRAELDHVSQLFGCPPVLTTTGAAKAFISHGGFTVTCTDQIRAAKCWSDSSLRHQGEEAGNLLNGRDDEICTILFTSGSTGPAKAVQFSHHQLLASSRLKCLSNNMVPDDRFLCWISFDHSVALCELHLQAMEAGANLFMIPSTEFTSDPRRFWEVLSEQRISYTFAPNSFLAAALRAQTEAENQTSEDLQRKYNFRNLKVLFCGGEANRTTTLAAAADFLTRHGAIDNAVTAVYGLSETCSALFYNRNGPSYDVRRKHAFASVGEPLPTHQTRIVDGDRNPTKHGAVQLYGPMIFRGYYNNIAATESCTTEDGWFDTGDLGYLEDNGNLVINGRSKDVLVLNGQNYSCGELEYAIETSGTLGIEPGFTVSFSVWNDESDGEELVILFNPVEDKVVDSPMIRNTIRQINKAVVSFCRKRPLLVIPLPKSSLPRSSIGKLSRAKLRTSFVNGDFDEFKLMTRDSDSRSERFASYRQEIIANVFVDCLKIPEADLSPTLPIEDLGIDSLSYLKLRSAFEQAFPTAGALSIPQLAACHNIQELDDMLARSEASVGPAPYKPLEVLRSTGSKTPLILCHVGNGGFLNYMGLWPLLRDRQIFALQARGTDAGQEPFETMDEMLDVYTAAIKKQQPSGPYALFGSCLGGLISFELAKRLEALGDQVIFCGGLDSPVDVSIMIADVDDSYHLAFVLDGAEVIRRNDLLNMIEKIGDAPRGELVTKTMSLLPPNALENAGLSAAKLDAWIETSVAIHGMATSYRAKGRIHAYDAFYVTDAPTGADVSDSMAWRYVYIGEWKNHVVGASNKDLCTDHTTLDSARPAPLRLHNVPGKHETVIRPGNVEVVAGIIDSALLRRELEWLQKR